MEERINIVDNEISIPIEKLKEIIIDKWQSGHWFNYYYYNLGERGENLYQSIFDDLGDYANGLSYEISNEAEKKLNRPNIRLNWYDQYPKSDIRSIGFEVLSLLEGVGWGTPIEKLTTDDIPMILEFLDTPPEKSLEAWDRWEKYWTNLDYAARRKKLLEN
jgi:hypothetical protein